MKAEIEEKIESFNEKQRKLFDTSVFMSKMLAAGAFFHLLLVLYPNTYQFQVFLTELTQRILEIIGLPLERRGINLIDGNVRYVVTQDCLGWKSMAAYTALIFSSTSEYRKYVKPLLIGLLLIAVINVFRIVTTVYLSHIGFVSFEIIHSILWKWGLTFFVVLIWIAYFHQNSGK